MTNFFKGIATALPTPFRQGKVDFQRLEEWIERQLSFQIGTLVLLGSTGEACSLSEEEREQIIALAREKTKKKAKLIVGTGNANTEKALAHSLAAKSAGADGLLVVTPYYTKCSQRGLVEYYKKICFQAEIPVIAYAVPSRTGVDVLPDTIENLLKIPNFAGLKDATGNIAQSTEILRRYKDECDLFVGDDALSLPLFALGAKGAISVLSNILPWEMKQLYKHVTYGELTAAQTLFYRLHPIMQACASESNPVPVKAALSLLNLGSDEMRSPLTTATSKTKERLLSALRGYGIV